MKQTDFSYLELIQGLRVLEPVWPAGGPALTLPEALTKAGKSDAQSELIHAAKSADISINLLKCPILAVLGGLNDGKSSVVSSFLSPQGRERIPRGVHHDQGTHRFIYWIPASWKAQEQWTAFSDIVRSVHGHEPEFLSNDQAEAAVQYGNGRDNLPKLNTPLVAYDSALDVLGAAFLDCPDIESR